MVSNDVYEYPIYVADTAKELGELCGKNPKTIISLVSQVKHGTKKSSIYRCVDVEDDEDYE